MFAITGITGNVGGALARTLLDAGLPVRAVVRDAGRARPWAERGCEIACASMDDSAALAAAFEGAEGVFILLPPQFDPAPGFPEARRIINAVRTALARARPAKVVCLSTIGAQADEANLLTQLTLMEAALRTLALPVTFVRPGWFMENTAWDIDAACEHGVLHSFLQPSERPVPMVATADVGRIAAELLQETWTGVRTVELEGPHRVSPADIARALARLLHREVRVNPVARDTWHDLFLSQGMRHPLPRMRMLDGFNEGWIDFEGATPRKGRIELDTVLRALLDRRGAR
jgi:NAD(P)H dehydrogenase (quinone)